MFSAPEDENSTAPEMDSGRTDQPESVFPFLRSGGKCFASEVLRLGEIPKIREETGGITRQLLQEAEL